MMKAATFQMELSLSSGPPLGMRARLFAAGLPYFLGLLVATAVTLAVFAATAERLDGWYKLAALPAALVPLTIACWLDVKITAAVRRRLWRRRLSDLPRGWALWGLDTTFESWLPEPLVVLRGYHAVMYDYSLIVISQASR